MKEQKKLEEIDHDNAESMRSAAVVHKIGAEALRERDQSNLSQSDDTRKDPDQIQTVTTNHEISAAGMLDDTIIDLVSDGRIDNITAQGLMLLFQLRQSTNAYSVEQRRSLSIVLQKFFGTLRLAMKDKPSVRRNNSRRLQTVELQQGMELFNTLNELLKLPETLTQHPLTMYLDNLLKSTAVDGSECQLREAILINAHFIICETFGINSQSTG